MIANINLPSSYFTQALASSSAARSRLFELSAAQEQSLGEGIGKMPSPGVAFKAHPTDL
jgi:hypothetical protein